MDNKEEKLNYIMAELIDKGNLAIIDEMFAPDYIAHAGGKQISGHAFLKRFTKQLRKTIPDIRAVDVQILAVDGDKIGWQRTLQGTHKEMTFLQEMSSLDLTLTT